MDDKKESRDLSKVDWNNLTPEAFAKMLVEKKDHRAEEVWALEEAQSRFLLDWSSPPAK